MTRPLRALKRRGFTLIELVVVISILAILAGLIIPRVGSWSEKSRYARIANDLKVMRRSLEYMYQDVGFYPRDVNPNIDPGLNIKSSVPSNLQSRWDGPYLEVWPERHPWGGSYDYEYWNYSGFNFDGKGGNEVLISVRNDLSKEILERIDEEIDDGNANSGMVRHNNSNWLGFYVGEGPKW